MAECGVCLQIYEEEVTKCPKLLPCNHTFCISCLKRIWNLEKSGGIKCPYCRKLHQIPSGHIDNLPTNQRLLKEAMKKNKIFTLPSPDKALRIDDGIGLCEQHGNPSLSIVYNVLDGTQEMFCETCLNPDSYVISERDSDECTGERESYQQAPYPRSNSTAGTENYTERNEENEIVLRPNTLTTRYDNNWSWIMESQWPLYEDIWTTNTNETSNRDLSLSEILKKLAFILSSPLIVSIGIIIALVTTVAVFIMGLCHAAYSFLVTCDLNFKEDTKAMIVKFVEAAFNKYEYVITRLFCCRDEVGYSRIVSRFCEGVAMIVKAVVLFLVYSAYFCISLAFTPVILVCLLVPFSILLILYCLYSYIKKIKEKCCGTRL